MFSQIVWRPYGRTPKQISLHVGVGFRVLGVGFHGALEVFYVGCVRCSTGLSKEVYKQVVYRGEQTLNPKPEDLNPKPEALNPKPAALNPKPEALNPKPEALNPKPQALDGFKALGLAS